VCMTLYVYVCKRVCVSVCPFVCVCVFVCICVRPHVQAWLSWSEQLLIPRSSVRFPLKHENSNSHGFELHRPSIKGTKVLLKVIKATIIIVCVSECVRVPRPSQQFVFVCAQDFRIHAQLLVFACIYVCVHAQDSLYV